MIFGVYTHSIVRQYDMRTKTLKGFAADSKNIIVSVKCGGNTPNDYDSK